MKNKNTGLKVLIVILIILILGLVGYIIYDKALKEENTTTNENTINETKNTNTEEIEINYDKIISEVKDKFDFTFSYFESVISFCGEYESSDKKIENTGINYNVSTQFTTYDDMYNYLKSYMQENIITSKTAFTSNKENYLEEDGKLYCATFGKGSPYSYGDSIIEIENIANNKITANAIKELIDPTEITTYKKFKITLEKSNENYIITSYDIQD